VGQKCTRQTGEAETSLTSFTGIEAEKRSGGRENIGEVVPCTKLEGANLSNGWKKVRNWGEGESGRCFPFLRRAGKRGGATADASKYSRLVSSKEKPIGRGRLTSTLGLTCKKRKSMVMGGCPWRETPFA